MGRRLQPSTDLLRLTDASFDAALAARRPLLVVFTATWCWPCRELEPVLAKLAAEVAGFVTIALADVDAAPMTMMRLKARAVPTLQIYRRGQLLAEHVGKQDEKLLRGWIVATLDRRQA